MRHAASAFVFLFFASLAASAGAQSPSPTAPANATPPTQTAAPPPPARDPSYEGTAAPPTLAGNTDAASTVHPGMELFAEYDYLRTYSGGTNTWYHVFDVPRAHASLDGKVGDVRARLLLEGVRSASQGALVGVGGDSIVIRIREAYAAWEPIHGVEGAIGVVPTFTIAELDGTWMLRPIAATTLESSGLASPADLGVRLRYTLPERYGFVGLAAYNGEGYTNQELNRGKNVEGAVEIHPLPRGALLPLALFASYVSGSSGTDLAEANRFTGGVLWQGRWLRAGASYTYAWGVGDDSSQRSTATDIFARLEPVDRLIFGLRGAYWLRATGAPSTDAVTTVSASVGYRIAAPLEVHLAATRSLPTTTASGELPGDDSFTMRAIAHVLF